MIDLKIVKKKLGVIMTNFLVYYIFSKVYLYLYIKLTLLIEKDYCI